jgi:hypothetical protein
MTHLFAEEEMMEAASEGGRRPGALGHMVGWKADCGCVGCGRRDSRAGQKGLGRGKKKKERRWVAQQKERNLREKNWAAALKFDSKGILKSKSRFKNSN